ncbi:putative acetyltransferase [Mycobacterium basiliense]|uniref:Putative acetyltransferase n=1 Tax=Mycobacterium basiliense TaxID=2094119 RepID=A0A3S4FK71_9MYCO|nr:GNAT family N-acetyltransferase [Mycobacterium basiliense]VDM87047.1 putative acetyltransferase [Mycobacterium basiliense]
MSAQPGSSEAVGELRFVPAALDDPLAQPLLNELAVEYAQRYGSTPATVLEWFKTSPASEFALPHGGMLIGVVNGEAVTGGAFCRLDADTAELKRIWTHRDYRRRGYAQALLALLEAQIVARGYRNVYLVTGDRQPEAEALYEACGYARLPGPLPSRGPVLPIAFLKRLT